MVFNDADVNLGVETKTPLQFDFIAIDRKTECLLIEGGGSKKSIFNTFFEPIGSVLCVFGYLFERFSFVVVALTNAITKSNDADKFFVRGDIYFVLLFAVSQSHPTSV